MHRLENCLISESYIDMRMKRIEMNLAVILI